MEVSCTTQCLVLFPGLVVHLVLKNTLRVTNMEVEPPVFRGNLSSNRDNFLLR